MRRPFDDDRGGVVLELAVLVRQDRAVESAKCFRDRSPVGGFTSDEVNQPIRAEEAAARVTGFDNAIGVEQQSILALESLLSEFVSPAERSES